MRLDCRYTCAFRSFNKHYRRGYTQYTFTRTHLYYIALYAYTHNTYIAHTRVIYIIYWWDLRWVINALGAGASTFRCLYTWHIADSSQSISGPFRRPPSSFGSSLVSALSSNLSFGLSTVPSPDRHFLIALPRPFPLFSRLFCSLPTVARYLIKLCYDKNFMHVCVLPCASPLCQPRCRVIHAESPPHPFGGGAYTYTLTPDAFVLRDNGENAI